MKVQNKIHKSKASGKTEVEFDKYDYYIRSVQAPDHDVVFMRDVYKENRKKAPISMREDFCGTHALSCEWIKLNNKNTAYGVDLDLEPISYGQLHYASKLAPQQRSRLQVHQADVLNPGLPKADIICAMNFSHFIFKERQMMKSYLHNCLTTLNDKGILIMDCFGGPACHKANEEETEHKSFKYFWEQESYNPITHHAVFHIHYKPKGKPKINKVFTYDWRMWSIAEIREMMLEVGFQKTFVYWEGTTKDGGGDGNFVQSEVGDECYAWVAYIAGLK